MELRDASHAICTVEYM